MVKVAAIIPENGSKFYKEKVGEYSIPDSTSLDTSGSISFTQNEPYGNLNSSRDSYLILIPYPFAVGALYLPFLIEIGFSKCECN